jgi:pimeloyl-ACP methyl ester carboxylesterase
LNGFSVLRFNFRGVGRSQGYFDNGPGELSDAASALDWLQLQNPDSRSCWIAGVSFGTWIAMQLLMRRPEIDGFICVAPPANLYDYSFLAPCPSSGLMVNGDKDRVVPSASIGELAAQGAEGRQDRARSRPRGQSLLPGPHRGPDQGRRHLRGQAHDRDGEGPQGVALRALLSLRTGRSERTVAPAPARPFHITG